jgi:hypothetical protein
MPEQTITTPHAEHPTAVDPSPPDTGDEHTAGAAVERTRELEAELVTARVALTEAHAGAETAQRRHQITLALVDHGALDLEAAMLVAEAALAAAEARGTAGTVASVVADLRRQRPALFRTPQVRRTSVMSGELPPQPPQELAITEARRTGDRRALMHYLRLRRGS